MIMYLPLPSKGPAKPLAKRVDTTTRLALVGEVLGDLARIPVLPGVRQGSPPNRAPGARKATTERCNPQGRQGCRTRPKHQPGHRKEPPEARSTTSSLEEISAILKQGLPS